MNPRERHQAVLHGQEPDKVNVIAAAGLRAGPQGGWMRRMAARGMGVTHIVPPYKPTFFYDHMINPGLEDIEYVQCHYIEKGVSKTRHTLKTPFGAVDSIAGHNPGVDVLTASPLTYFVKQESDWRIINYVFERMLDAMRPNYEEMLLDQDDLGDSGYTIAVVDKTPFQRTWIELASIEQAAIDFHRQTEGVQHFLDINRRFHERAAEITAGCPSDHVLLIDNITNIISPKYYRQYCRPYYEIYARAFEGTSKVLAVHFDGLFAHLADEIAQSPFQILDSFSVPPTGNVSLSRARELWPDKIPFVNLPAHLAYADEDELHRGYAQILEERGSKVMSIEHVEDLPPERLEMHLSAALDVCGY